VFGFWTVDAGAFFPRVHGPESERLRLGCRWADRRGRSVERVSSTHGQADTRVGHRRSKCSAGAVPQV